MFRTGADSSPGLRSGSSIELQSIKHRSARAVCGRVGRARVGLPLPARGRNALAGYPGRLVGGKEQRNPRNIVRPAKPPHGEREAQHLRGLALRPALAKPSVSVMPGAMALTRISLAANSTASSRVIVSIALLDAEETRVFGEGFAPDGAQVYDAAARTVESFDGLLRGEDRAQDIGVELAMNSLRSPLRGARSCRRRRCSQGCWVFRGVRGSPRTDASRPRAWRHQPGWRQPCPLL